MQHFYSGRKSIAFYKICTENSNFERKNCLSSLKDSALHLKLLKETFPYWTRDQRATASKIDCNTNDEQSV